MDNELSLNGADSISSGPTITNNDNTTTIENHLSDIVLRTVSRTDAIYDKLPKPYGMNYKVQMDYSAFLDKPFYVAGGEWKTTDTRLSNIHYISVPKDIISISDFTAVPFTYSCYYRAKAKLILHLNGTPMHSGVLVATSMPVFTNLKIASQTQKSINTYIQAPHQFLYANQSSAIEVELPMYTNFPVARTTGLDITAHGTGTSVTGDSYGGMCDFLLVVLNPLKTTGGSTSIRYTMHCVFEELEFFVPTCPRFNSESLINGIKTTTSGLFDSVFKSVGTWARTITSDALDSGRQMLRMWTGLHSPNRPALTHKQYIQGLNNNNCVDAPTAYDKLDPYLDYTRVCDDTYFKTDIDEGDYTYLCGKYQHIGTFAITQGTTNLGTLLFSRPICPFQEVVALSSEADNPIYSVIEKLSLMSSAWRGDLEVKIQSSMTNFQNCKLFVVLDYSKSSFAIDNVPNFEKAAGMITHTFEFSGGGTNIEFTLPYISEYPHLPTTPDWTAQAVSHGVYRIYLLQPLVSADSQPSVAEFNVYLRGKPNFQLFGYPVIPFDSKFGYAPIPPGAAPVTTTKDPGSGTTVLTTTQKAITNARTQEARLAQQQQQRGKNNGDGTFAMTPEQRAKLIKPFRAESIRKFKAEGLTTVTASIVDNNSATKDKSDDPKIVSVNPVAQLRPIVNMRDITRRLYDTWNADINPVPDNEVTNLTLHLSDLIAGTHQDDTVIPYFTPVHVARMLYHGFRGGLKVRVKAYGATGMMLNYFPPQATVKKQTVDTTPFYTMWDAPLLPGENVPNLYTPYTEAHFSQPGSANGPKIWKIGTGESAVIHGESNSMVIGEIEIPYMSACDFVGSINSVAPVSTTSLNIDSLGYLYITLVNDTVVADNTATPPEPTLYAPQIDVVVSVGFSDEARLGMAVYSPPLFLPTVTPIPVPPNPTITYFNLPYVNGELKQFRANKAGAAPKAFFTLSP